MSKTGMSPAKAEELRIKKGIDRGTKLRVMRVKKGLSQSELAVISGLPISTIQVFEQKPYKTDRTKLETLCDLCETLGCKISDIVDDDRTIERFNKVK